MKTAARFLLVVLLCMLPWAALAADSSVALVPSERMVVFPVEGLSTSGRTLLRDGLYEMEILSETTDWSRVLTYGGYTDTVRLNLGVSAPAGADRHIAVVGRFASDQAILQALSGSAGVMNITQARNSRAIAAYSEEHGVASPIADEPTNANGTLCMAIKWMNGSSTVCIEKMTLVLRHTSMQGRSVSPVKLPMAQVLANDNHVLGVTATVEDGQVTYLLSPEAAAATASEIITRFPAPAEAASYDLAWSWGDVYHEPLKNGAAEVFLPFKNESGLFPGRQTESFSLIWRNAAGDIIGGGRFTHLSINTANDRPWPAYVQDAAPWQPVPYPQRLKIQVEAGADLIDYSYADGHAYFFLSDKALLKPLNARKLPDARVRYSITPPSGANYVRVARSSGDMFWGPRPDQPGFINMLIHSEPLLPVHGKVETGASVFLQMQTALRDVTLYGMNMETAPNRGTDYVFYWYKNATDETPMLVEWIAETAEPIVLAPKTQCYPRRSSVVQRVEAPVLIDEDNRGWTLYAHYNAQQGENAYQVELQIYDENGQPVTRFDKPVSFYLPYPEGVQASGYALKHYANGVFGPGTDVTIEADAYGVFFTVQSLSPFVLTWDEVSPPSLPATGDRYPLFVLLTLFALSGAALALGGRRLFRHFF